MNEPLKNKGIKETRRELPQFYSFGDAMVNCGAKIDVPTGKILFREEDVESAVGFLKIKIKKIIKDNYYSEDTEGLMECVEEDILEEIDEAFSDVLKERG